MTINLDGDFSSKKKAPTVTSDPNAELGLVISSDVKVVTAPAASNSLTQIYDKLKKLIFLFDISGSMAELVPGAKMDITMFEWPSDEDVLHIVARRAKDEAEEAIRMRNLLEQERTVAGPYSLEKDYTEALEKNNSLLALAEITDVAKLKQVLVDSKLVEEFYQFGRVRNKVPTKLRLVQKLARKVIEDRVKKYPDADIVAMGFDTSIEMIEGSTVDQICDSIDRLSPRGGTHIGGAMEYTLAVIKASPSTVKMHHIVLVTDGQDGSGRDLARTLPEFKKLGVVIDFIFMSSEGGSARSRSYENDEAIAIIKSVCEATGGTYTKVTDAGEFETKFLAASTRLLLPAPSV